jgi:hypothetical protein
MVDRAWLGLALLILILGGGCFRIRAQRKAGAIRNFGHPILDSVLLFSSGLLLATALGFGLWLLNLYVTNSRITFVHFLFDTFFLVLAGSLWWVCNMILCHVKRRD